MNDFEQITDILRRAGIKTTFKIRVDEVVMTVNDPLDRSVQFVFSSAGKLLTVEPVQA